VWVDAPIEYISSTKQYTERVGAAEFDWEAAWRADGHEDDGSPVGGGEVVHVIGRDIIQHHTVFWPAMLHASGYTEPRAVMASGFVNLDGQAFSTSRNRAVWADDYLEEGLHPDLLRYYLTTAGGFQQDVDFSWAKFRERVNSELADTVGNFVYRALLFAERNYGGTPDVDVSDDVRDEISDAVEEFEAAVNDYSLRRAGRAGVELAAFGNRYIQRNEPWNLVDDDPDAAAQVIRDSVQVVKAVAVLLSPFAPGKADEVWSMLDEAGSVHDAALDDCLAAPPASFGEPAEPVAKVEAERVERLNEELAERIEAASDDGADEDDVDLEPLAEERVSFEAFQDLDLRVGEIETATGIEGADDLARLEVDIGAETRQIVAGIKQLHDLDALPGTRVVVVANLERTELFGVESDGMVLAAGEDADLLTTHGDSPPGTKIR
jgi:methionyl-tRNA synthetase